MTHTLRILRRCASVAAWLVAPLLAVLATLVIVAMLPREPAAREQPRPASAAPVPYVSSDPSLPAAGTYSILAQPQPHVEAF